MAAISTLERGSEVLGACSSIESMASSCSSKTPSLSDAAMTDWAKCLCFDKDGQFNPNPFDDNASSCYDSMTSSKTVHGKEFSNTYTDFCSKNVDAGPTTSSSGVSNLVRSLQKATQALIQGIQPTTTASSGSHTSSTPSRESKGTSASAPSASSSGTPSPSSPPNTNTASDSTSLTASANTAAAVLAGKISWMVSFHQRR